MISFLAELVQSNSNTQGHRIPLCSDAYTYTKNLLRSWFQIETDTQSTRMWQAADPNAKGNNEEVLNATYRILDELIPSQADDIINTCIKDADRYLDLVRLF